MAITSQQIRQHLAQEREKHKNCHVWEFPTFDERLLKAPLYPFTLSGERKIFNSVPKELVDKMVENCNGISFDGLSRFKTAADAQQMADMILRFNKTMECVITQYCINDEFQQRLDDEMLPYLIMNKISEE